jgi:hypothetical protein
MWREWSGQLHSAVLYSDQGGRPGQRAVPEMAPHPGQQKVPLPRFALPVLSFPPPTATCQQHSQHPTCQAQKQALSTGWAASQPRRRARENSSSPILSDHRITGVRRIHHQSGLGLRRYDGNPHTMYSCSSTTSQGSEVFGLLIWLGNSPLALLESFPSVENSTSD